jgi:hypothetical protein
MLHLIDTGDQFAAGDRSINSINFLQYSEKEFSKYNSAICFQNRLRPPTYLQIIKEHNFEILIYETQVDSRALRELPQMKIHSEFLNMTPEEICTKSVFVLAKKGTGQKFQEVSLTS